MKLKKYFKSTKYRLKLVYQNKYLVATRAKVAQSHQLRAANG